MCSFKAVHRRTGIVDVFLKKTIVKMAYVYLKRCACLLSFDPHLTTQFDHLERKYVMVVGYVQWWHTETITRARIRGYAIAFSGLTNVFTNRIS